MSTEFFMAMKPPTATHQEKKVAVIHGKPVFYEPDDLKAARAKLMAHLGKHVPKQKYAGHPLRVVVKWMFPITSDEHFDGEWKMTAPDTHNLDKLLFDVMTDLGFWSDDAIVSSEIIEKFWSHRPGIYIKIECLHKERRG